MNSKHVFVYAVCGERKYIDSLEVSLSYLARFTKNNSIVVTDSSRNEKIINHPHIIDIKTDTNLSNHQAAIFLKTSLHRYLNLNDTTYCYIDTDVLAISEEVQSIFNQKINPIGFCADSVTFDFFSPYATHCKCIEECSQAVQSLKSAAEEYLIKRSKWEEFIQNHEGRFLLNEINAHKKISFKNFFSLINFAFSRNNPFLTQVKFKGYFFDKKTKFWYNKNGETVLHPIVSHDEFVQQKTGFNFNKKNGFWTKNSSRKDVTLLYCTHLHDLIKKNFSINIYPDHWQHPNGGVFIFNKDSVPFIEQWHRLTLKTFSLPEWKTCDQGTLATCIWANNLQKMPYLDPRYNYILDYNRNDTKYIPSEGFCRINSNQFVKPFFVHVCNNFNNPTWEIWSCIEMLYKNGKI